MMPHMPCVTRHETSDQPCQLTLHSFVANSAEVMAAMKAMRHPPPSAGAGSASASASAPNTSVNGCEEDSDDERNILSKSGTGKAASAGGKRVSLSGGGPPEKVRKKDPRQTALDEWGVQKLRMTAEFLPLIGQASLRLQALTKYLEVLSTRKLALNTVKAWDEAREASTMFEDMQILRELHKAQNYFHCFPVLLFTTRV